MQKWLFHQDALDAVDAWSYRELKALQALCDKHLEPSIQKYGNNNAHRAIPGPEFPFPHQVWLCVDDPETHVIRKIYEAPFLGAHNIDNKGDAERLYYDMREGRLEGEMDGRKMRGVQVDKWGKTPIFRLDVTTTDCEECYGTGFYKGIGANCSKGCPPKSR